MNIWERSEHGLPHNPPFGAKAAVHRTHKIACLQASNYGEESRKGASSLPTHPLQVPFVPAVLLLCHLMMYDPRVFCGYCPHSRLCT